VRIPPIEDRYHWVRTRPLVAGLVFAVLLVIPLGGLVLLRVPGEPALDATVVGVMFAVAWAVFALKVRQLPAEMATQRR
jgi:hypothetical protein